jgi:hypothetical protein
MRPAYRVETPVIFGDGLRELTFEGCGCVQAVHYFLAELFAKA